MDAHAQKRPRLQQNSSSAAKWTKGANAQMGSPSKFIPLRTTGSFGVPGLHVTDHFVTVPLVHGAPEGHAEENIEVIAISCARSRWLIPYVQQLQHCPHHLMSPNSLLTRSPVRLLLPGDQQWCAY